MSEAHEPSGGSEDPTSLRTLLDVVGTLAPDVEEVAYVGTQGQKVTLLGHLGHLSRLRVLCLRSNLLRSMAGVEEVAATLEELELYDNEVECLEGLGDAARLRLLDVSYNRLSSIDGLAGNCPALVTLYSASNRLSGADASIFSACASTLRVLDLGANGLRSMAFVSGLVALEELWLGKNKITRIEGLERLSRLRILDVQSCRLTDLSGLGGGGGAEDAAMVEGGGSGATAPPFLPALEELYIGHNALTTCGDALRRLRSLLTLDLTGNALTSVSGLNDCTLLTDVWLGYNRITTFPDAIDGLRALAHLEVVYLEHNPLAADWEYRLKLTSSLPALKQLDATAVTRR